MNIQEVILVDESDARVGTMEKMEAHHRGVLHRAFSVFIFNSSGEMLLQQRAAMKYHSAGLWTNACCSHPFPGEETHAAATRRLHEELGFTTPLEKIFDFVYRAEMENGLIEHEFDHVFTGQYDGPVMPEPTEVSDVCFQDPLAIRKSLEQHPERYTTWFRIAFPRIEQWWLSRAGRVA